MTKLYQILRTSNVVKYRATLLASTWVDPWTSWIARAYGAMYIGNKEHHGPCPCKNSQFARSGNTCHSLSYSELIDHDPEIYARSFGHSFLDYHHDTSDPRDIIIIHLATMDVRYHLQLVEESTIGLNRFNVYRNVVEIHESLPPPPYEDHDWHEIAIGVMADRIQNQITSDAVDILGRDFCRQIEGSVSQ